MTTISQQDAAAEAAGWVWANVARPLKFVFMWFAFMGSIGHMGRALIEGLDWWVKIVDLYHWIMTPVAGVLETLLKAPILWIASWFDIALELPEFPIWGVDIIVLANIAAGFLVFKKWMTIPAQIFVSLTIIVSLGLLILAASTLFSPVGGLLLWLALIALSMFLANRAFSNQVWAIVNAEGAMSMEGQVKLVEAGVSRDDPLPFYRETLRISVRRYFRPWDFQSDTWAGTVWRVALTYAFIFMTGFLALALNAYADVTLPVVTRLGAAWDTMILEKVLQPSGLG